ncbi:hypothetical protein OB955_13635 [Halobacteria archaeon AArc-m2/3/4]|uniref:Uncharacterized protein n=1 Tax=Natronoglomus mannanivorans TaxID=2979990 RepID=A0ABT2QFU7_9EURY|nr:hypothetical protein [Halobacteria archaeon AArc-m2/3/4]
MPVPVFTFVSVLILVLYLIQVLMLILVLWPRLLSNSLFVRALGLVPALVLAYRRGLETIVSTVGGSRIEIRIGIGIGIKTKTRSGLRIKTGLGIGTTTNVDTSLALDRIGNGRWFEFTVPERGLNVSTTARAEQLRFGVVG